MLPCRDVPEQMSDYLDHTVGWRTRAAIRLHLLMCGFCRRYARQMRTTVMALRSLRRRAPTTTDDAARAAALWAEHGRDSPAPPGGDGTAGAA